MTGSRLLRFPARSRRKALQLFPAIERPTNSGSLSHYCKASYSCLRFTICFV
jgi:hypothetical protein